MSEQLKPCPSCGGDIKLYSNLNPNDNFFAFARCTYCKKEYPLPTVKLSTWDSKRIGISKKMINDAVKAWNRRAYEHNSSKEVYLEIVGGEEDSEKD